MPHRNWTNEGQGTTILRRSLRHLQTEPEDPKTPEPIPRRNRVPLSGHSRLSSTRKVSSKKNYKHYPEEASEEASESNNWSNGFMKSNFESRRSARLNSRVEGFSGKQNTDGCVERICLDKSKHDFLSHASQAKVSTNSHKKFLDTLEKRATPTSSSPNANGNADKFLGFTQGASAELTEDGILSGKGKAKVAVIFSTQCARKLEKRMTRSSSQRDTNITAEKTCNGKCNRFNVCASTDSLNEDFLSDEEKVQVDANLPEQAVAKIQKRITRSSYKPNLNKYPEKSSDETCKEFIPCTMTECSKGVSLEQFTGTSGKRMTCSSVAYSMEKMGGTERKERQIDNGMKQNGVKKKRNQFEKGHGIVQGWTKEQELALRRAYFAAKPTPHFWKKVSRLVPGKSAQDCFNKIHSDNLTPPPHQPRSRANKANPSPLSLSPSKLLNSTKPKIRKTSYRKQKSRLLQKTVRELLQKQNRMNQDYEADLFSVLEPTLNPSTQVFQQGMVHSTSTRNLEKSGFLKRCQERSSSAHKKHMSQSSSLHGETLASPPVLKQVKNKALHEKYIDQLHCRDAKRKAALARSAKSSQSKQDTKESYLQKMDPIKAAKTALVFDAMDVINQFRHVEANATSDFSDAGDDAGDSDEDEGEYRL